MAPAHRQIPTSTQAFSADARARQQEKLKAGKRAGVKREKIPKRVEGGSGDCGDDLSDLGRTMPYFNAMFIQKPRANRIQKMMAMRRFGWASFVRHLRRPREPPMCST